MAPETTSNECNDLLTFANFSERQAAFLSAYRKKPVIARAAALAGINPCTVFRWRRCPRFVDAMHEAFDQWIAEHQARYRVEEEARQKRRELRELELRPAKLANLERVRARKRFRR